MECVNMRKKKLKKISRYKEISSLYLLVDNPEYIDLKKKDIKLIIYQTS